MTVEPVAPPEPGTEDWGDDLNAYLEHLETRIEALENRPEYLFSSHPWTFNNGAPPANINQVRLNSTDPTTATMIDIRRIDLDGADHTPIFQMLGAGSAIRINDWDNAAIIHRYSVTGAATMGVDNAQISVTWLSGSGALPNGKVNVAFFLAVEL